MFKTVEIEVSPEELARAFCERLAIATISMGLNRKTITWRPYLGAARWISLHECLVRVDSDWYAGAAPRC